MRIDKYNPIKVILLLSAILFLIVSCNKNDDVITVESSNTSPRLLSLKFLCKENAESLVEDIECDIIGDSIVKYRIPYLLPSKFLVPTIVYEGDDAIIDGTSVRGQKRAFDFSTPKEMIIKGESGQEKKYIITIYSFTGLPCLWIETEDRKDIVSKDEYLSAKFNLYEDLITKSPDNRSEFYGKIKGRGNSTWNRYPKKPYRIKLDEKVSLLGEEKDKSWVLLANYVDKSLLRNHLAHYMGFRSNLDYTPKLHYCELFLNGEFKGNYQIGEKINNSSHRVNVGDNGFILEVDYFAETEDDAVYFKSNHLLCPINIKEPALINGDNDYNYIKEFFLKAENSLFSDSFLDKEKGYKQFIDIDSFVDWYLIQEISKNNDACFSQICSSCYMHMERGGKLKMGPLWDFDIAFGNVLNSSGVPEGFYIKNATWISRMFEDPAFVEKVKTRFSYFYSLKNELMIEIDATALYLKYSVEENNNKWNVLYQWSHPERDVWGSFYNEVQYLKSFLSTRLDWMKNEFDLM